MLSMARYSQRADWGTSWVVRKLPCFSSLGLHEKFFHFFIFCSFLIQQLLIHGTYFDNCAQLGKCHVMSCHVMATEALQIFNFHCSCH